MCGRFIYPIVALSGLPLLSVDRMFTDCLRHVASVPGVVVQKCKNHVAIFNFHIRETTWLLPVEVGEMFQLQPYGVFAKRSHNLKPSVAILAPEVFR